MKCVKLLHAEKEIRPGGTEAYVCTLLATYSDILDGGALDPALVLGMSANDIIAPGSVLITPTQNFIAWDDNKFGAVGEAYGSDPSWGAYTVTYTYGDEEGTPYYEALVSLVGDGTHTVIGAPNKLPDGSPVSEGVVFAGWEFNGTTVQPGDEIAVEESDIVLEPTWLDNNLSLDDTFSPADPGGGLGHN